MLMNREQKRKIERMLKKNPLTTNDVLRILARTSTQEEKEKIVEKLEGEQKEFFRKEANRWITLHS